MRNLDNPGYERKNDAPGWPGIDVLEGPAILPDFSHFGELLESYLPVGVDQLATWERRPLGGLHTIKA
jgi:hypothetical protein